MLRSASVRFWRRTHPNGSIGNRRTDGYQHAWLADRCDLLQIDGLRFRRANPIIDHQQAITLFFR